MSNDTPYRCGPGRPPLETRFQKGKSGNPSGRPKKSKPMSDILLESLAKKVAMRGPDGKVTEATLGEALIMATLRGGMENPIDRKLIFNLWQWSEASRSDARTDYLTKDDAEVLAEHRRALQQVTDVLDMELSISIDADGCIRIGGADLGDDTLSEIFNEVRASDAYERFVAGDGSQIHHLINVLSSAIAKARSPAPANAVRIQESVSATLIKATGAIEHRTK